MMKLMRKIFSNKITNNQKGSSLAITIIVIAVLAFSITSITTMTVNLSGATTAELRAVNNESIAKGLITAAIDEFQTFIDADGLPEDFDTLAILTKYNVLAADVTIQFPDFGDINGVISSVFKFEYGLTNGDTLYKLVYVSSSGTAFETDKPLEFGLATEGDLILNGGYYDEVKMFGENIYLSKMAPWQEDELDYVGTTHLISPSSSGAYPTLTDNGDQSEMFFGTDYKYCASSCFSVTEDGSNPYVINKQNYTDVQGSSLPDQGDIQSEHITSFFSYFDFEVFALEYATETLPTDGRSITDSISLATFDDVIRDNMDVITYKANGKKVQSYPNTPYVDITNDPNYNYSTSNENLKFGAVYDAYQHGGTLEINNDSKIKDFDDEGLIVLGDLVLNNTDSGKEAKMEGTYFVTGDLYLNGFDLDFNRITFIVLGETIIDFEYGYGFTSDKKNFDLSIVGQDNIRIEGLWEDYGTNSPKKVTMLMYTEESIYMNMVASKLVIEGSILARATGNSANPIFIDDNTGDPINGIVINSFRGYVNLNYAWDWDLWDWVKSISYAPSNQDTANRFSLSQIKFKDVSKIFMNIPTDFVDTGVLVGGETKFEVSEWKLE